MPAQNHLGQHLLRCLFGQIDQGQGGERAHDPPGRMAAQGGNRRNVIAGRLIKMADFRPCRCQVSQQLIRLIAFSHREAIEARAVQKQQLIAAIGTGGADFPAKP